MKPSCVIAPAGYVCFCELTVSYCQSLNPSVVSQLTENAGEETIFKQCAKSNPAQDLKNWVKIDRFPLAFTTLQLEVFQNAQAENSRGSAFKQPMVFQTWK